MRCENYYFRKWKCTPKLGRWMGLTAQIPAQSYWSLNEWYLCYFLRGNQRTTVKHFHHWWIFSLKLTTISLNHFLHQHITHLNENFEVSLLKRIVLKMMVISEEKNNTVLYLISVDITNSGRFHSSLDPFFLPSSFSLFFTYFYIVWISKVVDKASKWKCCNILKLHIASIEIILISIAPLRLFDFFLWFYMFSHPPKMYLNVMSQLVIQFFIHCGPDFSLSLSLSWSHPPYLSPVLSLSLSLIYF